MKFLVLGVFLCVVALSQGYKEFGIVTPEELQLTSGSRIIQGTPAGANQFPHQVYQLITLNSGSRITCGGSLIGTRWVLTAAHCLQGARSTDLYLGSVRIDSSPVRVTSTNLHVHPNYNSQNLNNDVALAGLSSDIPTGANIRVIAFAKSQSDTFEGQTATASGFGYTANNGPTSATLNYANLRVVSNSVCAGSFGSLIIPSTICAAGISSSAQGVCSGDSGGPLIIGSGTNTLLIGVTSFVSSNGCSSAAPSGFARPNHFTSWINSISGL